MTLTPRQEFECLSSAPSSLWWPLSSQGWAMAYKRRAHRPEHRALYNLPQWSRLRRKVLDRDNYTCQWVGCGKLLIGKGNVHNSPVAHHKQDHKGDMDLFLDESNIIAVCKQCHDQQAQRFTHRGYISGHDDDGRPLDPSHPWNCK